MTPVWRLAFGALGAATALTAASIGFLLSGDEPVAGAPSANSDAILVVRQPIEAGVRIAQSDIEWRTVPAGGISPDAIRRSRQSDSEVIGAIAQRSMIPGEVIRKGAISVQPVTRSVATSLNPGWRAVTITPDAAQATGLLKPNDRVDLFLGASGSGPLNASAAMATSTSAVSSANAGAPLVPQQSLTNVRVIAINGSIEAATPPKDGEASQRAITSVSFEVLPMHVRPIITAAEAGQLVVALRSPLEPAPAATSVADGTGRASAKPGRSPRRASKRAINPPDRGSNDGAMDGVAETVTVIRGGGSTRGE